MNFAELIQQCDADIKSGQPTEVGKRLLKISLARVPREWRLPLAKVCRRAGLYALGLKLLSKICIDPDGFDHHPSASELSEYAVLLQRSGALSEALHRLHQINSKEAPEVLLFRAFAHFARWEFREAIPQLEDYLKTDLKPYDRVMGQINLAFALIESGLGEAALKILNGMANVDSRQLNSTRHALIGQIYFQQGQLQTASENIEKARSLVPSASTNDQLFALKWKLIIEGIRTKNIKPFEELKRIARQGRAWEFLRAADLFSLKVRFSESIFSYMYFGSPYEGFRAQVREELGRSPDEKIFILGEKHWPCIDMATGQAEYTEGPKPGRKIHQLLNALLRDFYRPVSCAGIFSEVFPGEHYDIWSSPHRIHQLISRTRQWVESQKLPLEITEQNGFYRLNITGQLAFKIPVEHRSVELSNLQLDQLKTRLGTVEKFTVKDICKELKLSGPTVHRLIHRALSEGQVQRIGAVGRSTLYRWAG